MKEKNLKVNAILNIIYSIFNVIFPLLTFPYISRVLLVDNMGKINFFNSLANYSIAFGALGVVTYGTRTVAQVKDDKKELNRVTQELLIINVIATTIIVFILLLLCFWVEKFKENILLLFIYVFYVFLSPISLNWLYSGLEKYKYITIRSIIFKIISLVLIFIFVKEKNDVIIYSIIFVFSNVASYLCNLIYSKKIIGFSKTELNLKRHLKPMLILFASSLAISVYINLDTIMLGFISGDEQVGLYTIAVKVKSILLTVVNAISVVLLPRFSYYLANNKMDDFKKVLKYSIITILLISIPIAFFFILEARDSILILGGKHFLDATICMQIVMPILVISGFSNITGNQVLIPMGREKHFMKAVFIGAIIDLILNLLLMPNFGCYGAAIATLIAECSQMIIQLYYSREEIITNIKWNSIMKIVFSTAISTLFTVIIMKFVEINAFVNIIIAAFIFFGTYLVLLLLLKEEVLRSYIKDFWCEIKKLKINN